MYSIIGGFVRFCDPRSAGDREWLDITFVSIAHLER